MGNPGSYDAFIAYSHAANHELARRLQQNLSSFAKAWYQSRGLRIFRDEASLSAAPGLWDSIQQALDSSRFLILMASPDTAASLWVDREVQHFLSNHPIGN